MTVAPLSRVHIVDDDELVRARISYLLSNHGYSTEIYTGGPEFFRDCGLNEGCILLDLRMPQMSGYEILEELARRGNTLPVVVLTACRDFPSVVRAMKLGAVDFIEKAAGAEGLLAAIGRALAPPEKTRLERNAAIDAATQMNCLSRRQRQVLQGLFDGLSNKSIAHKLGLSRRTVEMHRAKMQELLGVTTLSQVVLFAIRAALTPEVVAADMAMS